jgi:single-strand DNA-binding protein
MYINKAILIGNLTRDPEKRALPNGTVVTSMALATNRVWKDRDGKKQESTDYHNVVVFGRPAETAAQYLKKGQSVYVEGRIQTRSWDDKDGTKKYRTEIVADTVQFGAKAGGTGTYGADAGASSTSSAPDSVSSEPTDVGGQIDYPTDDINPEDIPF